MKSHFHRIQSLHPCCHSLLPQVAQHLQCVGFMFIHSLCPLLRHSYRHRTLRYVGPFENIALAWA